MNSENIILFEVIYFDLSGNFKLYFLFLTPNVYFKSQVGKVVYSLWQHQQSCEHEANPIKRNSVGIFNVFSCQLKGRINFQNVIWYIYYLFIQKLKIRSTMTIY